MPAATWLGLELFCNVGDPFWEMSDADLIALGGRELAQLSLAHPARIKDGAVVRMEKAYPVYDPEYRTHLATSPNPNATHPAGKCPSRCPEPTARGHGRAAGVFARSARNARSSSAATTSCPRTLKCASKRK